MGNAKGVVVPADTREMAVYQVPLVVLVGVLAAVSVDVLEHVLILVEVDPELKHL